MKQMSQRQEQVAEQIRNEISTAISRADFNSPLINGMVTVPHVWIAPDLRHARVYYSTLQVMDEQSIKEIGKALNAEAFRFQKLIASFNRKYTPRIKFYYDKDADRVDRINELFAKNGIGAANSDIL